MIDSIRLQHFRSYHDDSFEFSPSVNIIVGPNASGKTNLLEAILVVSRGSSYRANASDLVSFGQPWARLDAYEDETTRTVKIINQPQHEKSYEIAGRTLKRLRVDHMLPVVLFEPNHLLLLTGSPDRRREYLDDILAQTLPGYGATLRAYRRTLAQRNRLLKDSYPPRDQLFPWNVRLSELGARIVRARDELVQKINVQIEHLYQDISASTTEVAIAYGSTGSPEHYESYFLHQLESRVQDDIDRGFTSIGPHREDLNVCLNNHVAADVASRGETRTLVLALKVIELQLVEEKRDLTPLLLLDDVFSELDGARRRALTTHLKKYQTFITTTDADVVVQHFSDYSNVVLISKD